MPSTTQTIPPGLLDKVRALLAKAESTPFEAEAEALTRKAQELMARHRIERALLDTEQGQPTADPTARRVRIDDPYASAKVHLLGSIARANGCRAIWSAHDRCAHLIGFPDDQDVVDELFASLLLQAASALRREGSKRDVFGRSRTRRFRRAFLLAFAVRIGQRLRETVDATVTDVSASTGAALVPVLERRDARVEAAARAAFPAARSMHATVADGEGWSAGTAAADHVDLGGHRAARLTA
jgi:hypothetical protein